MIYRVIKLIESSIKNGRIYFPSSDLNFFPSDSLGDRKGDGHKGNIVTFQIGDTEIESDIRISSSVRISPRKSFGTYLRQINAKAGDKLKVSRISDRYYKVEYIKI